MWTFGILTQQGWRRTGTINILLAIACEVALLICLAVSISKREESTLSSTRILEGHCDRTSWLNTVLHLCLNIISTGILASSNFFMQVVTSPSRKEIDKAHMYLRSLKIGLQSPTNIPSLSRAKQICWVILLLSSVPVHLFFNSSIYSSAYQTVNWNVTIATSYFVQNGIENQTYWLPGASLAVSGSSSPAQGYYYGGFFDYEIHLNSSIRGASRGFGDAITNGYWGAGNTDVRKEIEATAQRCADWVKLTPELCMEEYRPYKFHTEFGNVVIVVHAGDYQPQGWTRDQVFNINFGETRNAWDHIVPPKVVNSLWFWAPCTLGESPVWNDTADYIMGSNSSQPNFKEEFEAYDHSCGRLFGLNTSQPRYHAKIDNVATLSFTNDEYGGNTTIDEMSRGYRAYPGARSLQIDHCLAEPLSCQVRVSNTLILIVIICVLVKIITCTFLLLVLTDVSFVTLGDAIESFISNPDPVTKGLGTLSLSGAQDLECKPRKASSTLEEPDLTFVIRPRRWTAETHRLKSSVYRGIWIQVYYPIFVALAAILAAVILSSKSDGLKTFGRSENYSTWSFGKGLNYLATLIVVSCPQLILSFLYLTVNALHTQLQVEQEWNSYARKYTSLRVSYPTGEQVSTYRLQLPYRYSIPLIATSILLHWLVSSSLFLLVVEGGAGSKSRGVQSRPDLAARMGVAGDTVIAIGYSGLSILIFFCTGVAVVLSPLILRYLKLNNDMVVGATNSLVLSAACHVPRVPRLSENDSDPDVTSERGLAEKEYLREVARGKVRWGAMPLPLDLAAKIVVNDDEPVMHLGFGTEDHDIQIPQTGMLYT